MQKTNRLALAVLALLGSTAAFAQSSVTLYGRVNTTVERQEVGNVKTTGLFDNNSRFGFKGTEDLGGGLKAGFQLESGFNSDTGASAATFFGRQSEVNLSGGFGTVRLGNFFPESYYATADYISMNNHNTGSSADALYYDPVWFGALGTKNKIGYRSPTFGGLVVDAAVILHEKAANTRNKNGYDLAANYNLGIVLLTVTTKLLCVVCIRLVISLWVLTTSATRMQINFSHPVLELVTLSVCRVCTQWARPSSTSTWVVLVNTRISTTATLPNTPWVTTTT